MSVRKLTSVQEARRVLRERRKRCERAMNASTIRDALRDVERQAWPRDASAWTPSTVTMLLRATSRRKKAALARAVRRLPGREISDVVTVQRRSDGTMRFWITRVSNLALPQFLKGDPRRQRGGTASAWASREVVVSRCQCTNDDLVAIDTLLDHGDKYAERLAKECAKGGGVLEGLKRRRRKR